jgi:hypothetical protein
MSPYQYQTGEIHTGASREAPRCLGKDLKWSNTPERNCILPEVLVKTALISIWTKFFVPIGFFTDSLVVINDFSSCGLSKWGKKGS